MSEVEPTRQLARATWAAGNWDAFSELVRPVGTLVLARMRVESGMKLLDVGTGSGGNVAIPAARLGAEVVGADVTPELLEHARRRAGEAGVEVRWLEADVQDLPFGAASFDRVTSTFGAMFAPNHSRAAEELVRVCRPGGRLGMTTWVDDGFAGELFKLTGRFMPPPPPQVQPPALWGTEQHIAEVFGGVGASAVVERESVDFSFASVAEATQRYTADLGPLVMARTVLEPQGRWEEFLAAFDDLVRRFSAADGAGLKIRSDYFLITVQP